MLLNLNFIERRLQFKFVNKFFIFKNYYMSYKKMKNYSRNKTIWSGNKK